MRFTKQNRTEQIIVMKQSKIMLKILRSEKSSVDNWFSTPHNANTHIMRRMCSVQMNCYGNWSLSPSRLLSVRKVSSLVSFLIFNRRLNNLEFISQKARTYGHIDTMLIFTLLSNPHGATHLSFSLSLYLFSSFFFYCFMKIS